MKRVLITGANSYIGMSVEQYITKNYLNECEFYTMDMTDNRWREHSFAGYDVILHVAGIAHQKETKENKELYNIVNRDLAIEVAKKAKADQVLQFIFLSSMSVYGKLKGIITQNTPLCPKSNYGMSKLLAENAILALDDDSFKVCILRPPMVYGKGCRGNYLALRKFALKLKFFPYIKNERSIIYVENLCEFIRLMIVNEESGIYFPQNDEFINTSEMVKLIASVYGRKIFLIHGFGWAIKFLGLFTRLITKAFGNLVYDKKMSEYKSFYAKYSLRESLEKCK